MVPLKTRKHNLESPKSWQSPNAGEREMLGIAGGRKASEGALLRVGAAARAGHLSLLCKKLPSQRLTRWRLLLEELHPKLVHAAGKDNDAAGALSRLGAKRSKRGEASWEPARPRVRHSGNGKRRRAALSGGVAKRRRIGSLSSRAPAPAQQVKVSKSKPPPPMAEEAAVAQRKACKEAQEQLELCKAMNAMVEACRGMALGGHPFAAALSHTALQAPPP